MNRWTGLRLVLLAVSVFLGGAHAAEASKSPTNVAAPDVSDEQRAQALLARAVAYYKEKGDLALGTFSRQSGFMDGELYVYVLSADGRFLASGGSSSALIDRNVAAMRDAAGKLFFQEMLDRAAASGAGIVEYRWLNRIDNKVERKVAYFEKVGNRIIAVGYYIPRATRQQAAAMLDKATAAVQSNADKAIAAFNDLNGGFIEDDLYVFVVSLKDGRFRAHGVSPKLINTDGNALRDPNGKPIIQQMITALKANDRGELDYTWRNPVTDKVENKHTLFRKADGLLIGVGYYTR